MIIIYYNDCSEYIYARNACFYVLIFSSRILSNRTVYNNIIYYNFPRRFGRRIRRALNSVYCARFNGREMYILGKLRRVRINCATAETGDFHTDRKYYYLRQRRRWCGSCLRSASTRCAFYIRENDTSINGFRYLPRRSPPNPQRTNLSRASGAAVDERPRWRRPWDLAPTLAVQLMLLCIHV